MRLVHSLCMSVSGYHCYYHTMVSSSSNLLCKPYSTGKWQMTTSPASRNPWTNFNVSHTRYDWICLRTPHTWTHTKIMCVFNLFVSLHVIFLKMRVATTEITSSLFLIQSSTRSFYRQGHWSQSFPVCSSNDMLFYSTKHQAITVHWFF